MVDGIEIDKKDAEDSLLPEDLNSLAVGSYVVPNPIRRKYYPAYILLVCALSVSYTHLKLPTTPYV